MLGIGYSRGMAIRIGVNSVLALVLVCSCGGGGGDGDSDGGNGGGDMDAAVDGMPLRMSIPVDKWATDLAYEADVPRQDVFAAELPEEFDSVVSASIDLEATLPSVQFTRTDGGANPATPTFTMSVRIVPGDNPGSACDADPAAGPGTLIGDDDYVPQSVEPASASADDMAMGIAKGGQFTVCVESMSNVDATLSVSEIWAEILFGESCAEPEDLAGTWSGTYTCTNECGGGEPEPGDITLVIAQNGRTAKYVDDGGAFYLGTVCGNTFTHRGFGMGYTEWGVFTKTGDNSATKMSTWIDDLEPECGGVCSDDLTRQ